MSEMIEIIDGRGTTVMKSLAAGIRESMGLDANGNSISVREINIMGTVLHRHLGMHGFFKLNEAHAAIEFSPLMKSRNYWKLRRPSEWYRARDKNYEINEFLDYNVGYCNIRNTPIDLSGAPGYVTSMINKKVTGSSIITDTSLTHQAIKPYPIKVIKGGPNRGTYGPILTLLSYLYFVHPAIHSDVITNYLKYTNVSLRIGNIFEGRISPLKSTYGNDLDMTKMNNSMDMSEYARHLAKVSGLDIGRTRLMELMRNITMLCDGNNGEYNTPNDYYFKCGYFYVIDTFAKNGNIYKESRITEEGVLALSQMLIGMYMTTFLTAAYKEDTASITNTIIT